MPVRATTLPARGATLVELLVALAIVAVLAAAAAPGLAALLRRNQADAAAEQITSAVRFTRHAAILRGRTATLCPGPTTPCGSGQWRDGAYVEVGGEVVLRLPPLPAGYTATFGGSRARLAFARSGMTTGSASFVICPPDGARRNIRRLVVNAQGRIYRGDVDSASC